MNNNWFLDNRLQICDLWYSRQDIANTLTMWTNEQKERLRSVLNNQMKSETFKKLVIEEINNISSNEKEIIFNFYNIYKDILLNFIWDDDKIVYFYIIYRFSNFNDWNEAIWNCWIYADMIQYFIPNSIEYFYTKQEFNKLFLQYLKDNNILLEESLINFFVQKFNGISCIFNLDSEYKLLDIKLKNQIKNFISNFEQFRYSLIRTKIFW